MCTNAYIVKMAINWLTEEKLVFIKMCQTLAKCHENLCNIASVCTKAFA